MATATLTLGGKRYVVLEEREYRRLKGEPGYPPLPARDARGNYPAAEALQVSIARSLIRRRRAVGLTQVELARRAGIRPETLNRIEQGKHAASVRTIDKIDAALRRAEDEDND